MSSSAITGPVLSDTRRASSGTAAAPSFAFNASTGTGVYLVSSDVLGLSTAGVQRVVVDASGNVGIGTASPTYQFELSTSNDPTSGFYRPTSNIGSGIGRLLWDGQNASATRVTYARIQTEIEGNTAGSHNGRILFSTTTNGTLSEKMRIDASGNLLVGTTDVGEITGPGLKLFTSTTSACYRVVLNTSISGVAGIVLYNTNATNNGYRFYVKSDGGIANYSGNNSNLSDERTKTNIELSGKYLEKICAIPVKLFNYKDEAEGEQRTLGVIAQDVEAVAPELVNNEGFGETPEGEEPLKSIYTTDMMFALMKCIQELKEKNDALEARLAALEAK